MPFGCLALWERRHCSSLSDVTDKYDIGHTLRVKEFCELCLAKERETGKVFFCKKFLKKDGRKVRKAAKNEIMILKMVNHPNILQLIDTFETRKEYFIIQELATGGDVFDWILDQGNYTERDASCVIRQVLEAVAYLHSLCIVHRNLKLESLMYYTENNHNKVVLRDFYLSRYENDGITEPCGTPEYLAPEVVARHRYGRPVDCWAIGVIMYILLSGNPPFYDDAEEDNTDQHNRIIFCRIVAGEFEFDSPYWDDISPAAKELVCRLMEVDPMLRITAQDALWHDWIAGQGASEKNLKDGVCAQFKKNFAKAKWRKAIQVTTFMQRLRAPESNGALGVGAPGNAGEQKGDKGVVTARSTMGVSHRVTIENQARDGKKVEERAENGETGKAGECRSHGSAVNGEVAKPQSAEERDTKRMQGDGGVAECSWKASALEAQNRECSEISSADPHLVLDGRKSGAGAVEQEGSSKKETQLTCSAHTCSCQKVAVVTPPYLHSGFRPASVTTPPAAQEQPSEPKAGDDEGVTDVASGSWCQTQLPEAVAEKGTRTREPKDDTREVKSGGEQDGGARYAAGTTELNEDEKPCRAGNEKKTRSREQGLTSDFVHCRSPRSSAGAVISGSFGKGVSSSGGWQMDSVIEEIEKQMAASQGSNRQCPRVAVSRRPCGNAGRASPLLLCPSSEQVWLREPQAPRVRP
ncbi:caM kinase-like vesicle-associated protein-like [Scleropages formosus]|uniref:CaM kinase-like vesicle-associated protein n=1 Tax=Scleropages formosus TaxID=113540 RepID=A0A0P7UMT6_SCLFO|nr:caM kinase-like vesicle-associated protein-like [Scleropages formosus]